MYDVSANLLSWISFVWGLVALIQVMFTYYRDYTVAGLAALFALMAVVVMSLLETKLTSQSLSIKGRSRSLSGFALALAAILLIATSNPAKRPATEPSAVPSQSSDS